MLMTVEGLYKNGEIRLLEPLLGITNARVLITIIPNSPDTQVNSLDAIINDGDYAIWEEFAKFRNQYPFNLHSIEV